MMQTVLGMALVVAGYIIGSIPFGLLIVKAKTGKDIRLVESGHSESLIRTVASTKYP